MRFRYHYWICFIIATLSLSHLFAVYRQVVEGSSPLLWPLLRGLLALTLMVLCFFLMGLDLYAREKRRGQIQHTLSFYEKILSKHDKGERTKG